MFQPPPIPAPAHLPKPGNVRKSPTQRTLALLKKQGFPAGIVERRNPVIKNKSMDLFHIIDIIALTPRGVLGVQSTGQDFSGHWKKLTGARAAESAQWLLTPGTSLLLIGWRKIKGDTGVLHWEPRIQYIYLSDLVPGLRAVGRTDLLERFPHPPAPAPQANTTNRN